MLDDSRASETFQALLSKSIKRTSAQAATDVAYYLVGVLHLYAQLFTYHESCRTHAGKCSTFCPSFGC